MTTAAFQAARNSRGRIYRYYVSSHLQQGGRRDGKAGMRLPAPNLEALVHTRLQCLNPRAIDWVVARTQLARVEVTESEVVITTQPCDRLALKNLPASDEATILEDGAVEIVCELSLRRWGGRSHLVEALRTHATQNTRIDRSLVRGLGRAHALVADAKSFPHRTVEELAQRQGATESYIRRLSRLAFLAPDIQRAILEGRQPAGLSLERLMRIDLPMTWSEQRRALGF